MIDYVISLLHDCARYTIQSLQEDLDLHACHFGFGVSSGGVGDRILPTAVRVVILLK